MVQREIRQRIDEYQLDKEVVEINWEVYFQTELYKLDNLSVEDPHRLPSFHSLVKYGKQAKLQSVYKALRRQIETILIQINVFNHFENYEYSAKLKYLADSIVFAYLQSIVYNSEKIYTSGIDEVETIENLLSDVAGIYHVLIEYFVNEISQNSKSINTDILNKQVGEVVARFYIWYDSLVEVEQEANV